MTSISLHPTPSPRTVAIEQFRAVGLALRKEAFFFIGALVLLGVLLISNTVRMVQMVQMHPHGSFHTGFTYGAAGAIPMFLVALLIPFGVWRSEDPSRRAYHWSMPVARGPHTIVKLLSGWAWLMIATVVYLLSLVILATVIRMITGEANTLGDTPVWQWIVAFTATTLGYLLTSIAVIGSDHAWRWIGGLLVGYGVLMAALTSFGMRDVTRALQTVFNGGYGLSAALVGSTYTHGPGMNDWLVAMPLWIIATGIAVTIASYRHSE